MCMKEKQRGSAEWVFSDQAAGRTCSSEQVMKLGVYVAACVCTYITGKQSCSWGQGSAVTGVSVWPPDRVWKAGRCGGCG